MKICGGEHDGFPVVVSDEEYKRLAAEFEAQSDYCDRLRKEALEALQQASVARNQAAALAEALRLVRPALDKARLIELSGRFGNLKATLPMAAGELVDAALNQADAYLKAGKLPEDVEAKA